MLAGGVMMVGSLLPDVHRVVIINMRNVFSAPRRSGPGHRRGAVSWQQRVPSVLASPAPFELVAAARLACAWLLEGEKEESKCAGIVSAALSQHHLSGFGRAPLEFHRLL